MEVAYFEDRQNQTGVFSEIQAPLIDNLFAECQKKRKQTEANKKRKNWSATLNDT